MGRAAEIRAAGSEDRDALLGLWLDLVSHHRRLDPHYPPVPGVREALLAEIERGLRASECRVWIGRLEAGAVGFLFAEVESPTSAALAGPSWIHELYVQPDSRRRGVARALVEQATLFFAERGRPSFSVRVESANEQGLAFWRELGFEEKALILEKRG